MGNSLDSPQKGRMFYGWWIVAVSWIALFFGIGIVWYSYGVFFVFWEQELGWSRTLISGAFSVGSAGPAVLMPFLGKLVETYGARSVMLVGAFIMGSGLILLSIMTYPWQLFLFFTIATFGFTILGHIPVATTLAKWFDKRRGVALGAAHTGMGTGGMVLTPLTTLLATRFGWRLAISMMGLSVWIVLIPLYLLVMRSKPGDLGLLPDNAEVETASLAEQSSPDQVGEGATVGQAMRSFVFWLLAFAFVVDGFAVVGVLSQQIPYLTDLKFSLGLAALAATVTASTHLGGKVIFGFLADRIHPRYVLSIGFACGFVGIIGLLVTRNLAMAIFASAFMGLAGAVTTVLQPLIVGSMFGNRSLGSILGVLFAINTLGFGLGPVISGLTFDMFGSYHGLFIVYSVGILVAAAVPLLIKTPQSMVRDFAEKG